MIPDENREGLDGIDLALGLDVIADAARTLVEVVPSMSSPRFRTAFAPSVSSTMTFLVSVPSYGAPVVNGSPGESLRHPQGQMDLDCHLPIIP